MTITRSTLLVWAACLLATSSGYRAPSAPREEYGSAPSPVYSKVHRQPSRLPASPSLPAYQGAVPAPVRHTANQWNVPATHGSAYGTIAAPHFNAQEARDELHAGLGTAHSSLQQAQAELQAGFGAAHSSAQAELQGTRAELQASLGAAHSSIQQTRAELQGTRAELQAGVDTAHSTVREVHAELQGTRAELQAGLDAAHSSVQEAQAELQGTRAELEGTRAELEGTRAELQASLAAANASIQEARARAEAAIGELAVFASQSRISLSTSFMLNKWRFIINQYFSPSKAKAPRIIVRDAATKGMVCVPRKSIGAFQVTEDFGTPLGGVMLSGERVSEQPEQFVVEEFQKAVQPEETIGQGQGIVVSVSEIESTFGYGGQGVFTPSGLGADTASTGAGESWAEHSGSPATSTVSGSRRPQGSAADTSFSVEEHSGIHDGTGIGVHVQSGSGSDFPATGGGGSAGRASASPGVLSSSAGGVSTGGGLSASASRASFEAGDAHATSSSVHRPFAPSGSGLSAAGSGRGSSGKVFVPPSISGDTHSGSSGSRSAVSADSAGRVSLHVSGPDAEAAAVGAGDSGVRLTSAGGLAYLGPADCECVEDYLCDEDGFINTSGVGLISVRSFSLGGGAAAADSRCGAHRVCCRHRDRSLGVAWEPHRCGTRSPTRLDARVISGQAARQGEFPWTVALMLVVPAGKVIRHEYLCGGSLIAPNVVLTGAHCINKPLARKLVARLGEWDTNLDDPVYPHQDLEVDQVIIHEQFDADTLRYDVALLRLKTPADLAAHVNTICLPDEDDYSIDFSDCFATGWGQESFGKAVYSSLLKKLPLRRVGRGQCESRLHETHLGRWFQLHETFMCAGGRPGVDPCRADGGSALVCRDTSPKNRDEETFVQVGTVAWDIGCRRGGFPGVFADIVRLAPWIRRVVSRWADLAPETGY